MREKCTMKGNICRIKIKAVFRKFFEASTDVLKINEYAMDLIGHKNHFMSYE